MPKSKQYWLFKTEPQKFAIQDLARAPKQTTCWEGVRNYQARNLMRDTMHGGDQVLIYHSNADPPGIAGLAHVVREAYPDHYAWDSRSAYYDPKSSAENPRWVMVDVQLDDIFPRLLALSELRKVSALKHMELLRKGSRLSIQPVRKREFEAILQLVKAHQSA